MVFALKIDYIERDAFNVFYWAIKLFDKSKDSQTTLIYDKAFNKTINTITAVALPSL